MSKEKGPGEVKSKENKEDIDAEDRFETRNDKTFVKHVKSLLYMDIPQCTVFSEVDLSIKTKLSSVLQGYGDILGQEQFTSGRQKSGIISYLLIVKELSTKELETECGAIFDRYWLTT